jgi:FixJ family two-component response regulator
MPGVNRTAFTVFVVDDDEGVLHGLSRLLRAHGYGNKTYSSARAFLDEHDASMPGCVVLDLLMPEIDGLNVQQELIKRGIERTIIFLTGVETVGASVKALKAGASDFLLKPYKDGELLNAIKVAEKRDSIRLQRDAERKSISKRIDTLSPREREVMDLVVRGTLNKNIAADMGTGIKTTKVHRGRVMKKMGVKSVAELVRLTSKILSEPR